MPEGHTIHRWARQLNRDLAGDRLEVTSPQGRFGADAARVDGAVLDTVEAWGKHLFFEWSTGEVGHVHLGLFGRFRVHRGPPPAPSPRGAVRMRLSGPRATIDLTGPTACSVGPPCDREAIIARLGPDPLRSDARPERALDAIGRSRRAMGALLLDQSVIAGLGNIYRAEALFVHGIHPERPGRHCTRDELIALWDTSRTMLRAGVRSGRIVTVARHELGLAPRARIPRREATYVYQRRRCLRCDEAIVVSEVGNRTCYHCPGCQAG